MQRKSTSSATVSTSDHLLSRHEKDVSILTMVYNFVVHLRLKFNLILMPLFFFGVFVSEGNHLWTSSFWMIFFVLHICMYGGANSLNSYYDKDEGPIGGLAKPPPVEESTFYLSWFVQLIGFIISFWGPRSFTYWFLAGMVMSVCYSHPMIRLKSSPVGSVIIVSFMQGFGAFCAGWIAGGRPVLDMLSPKGLLGSLSIQLMTAGLYPLTQVYQYKEDLKHKDRTLSIALGIPRTFYFAQFFIFLSGVLLECLVYIHYSKFQAFVLFLYLTALLTSIGHWGRYFKVEDVDYNFKVLHAINFINSACFFGFTMGHLSGILTYL